MNKQRNLELALVAIGLTLLLIGIWASFSWSTASMVTGAAVLWIARGLSLAGGAE